MAQAGPTSQRGLSLEENTGDSGALRKGLVLEPQLDEQRTEGTFVVFRMKVSSIVT